MEKMQNQQSFTMYKGPNFYLVSLFITIVLAVGLTIIGFFTPNFIQCFQNMGWGKMSFWDYLSNTFLLSDDAGLKVGGIVYLTFFILSITTFLLPAWLGIRYMLVFLNYNNWISKYTSNHAQIINSCNVNTFNDRVAMVVTTCNDLSPNTLLQTSKQTYKNMDVWISDDSSNPEKIKQIDDFAKQHGFHVLHRDPAHKKVHPTKVGNMMYFLEKYGDKYDYIFENDSSSITTSTFVENCLCYFHSPLIEHDNIGGIVCNGYFYGTKNLIGYLQSNVMQWTESCVNSTGVAEANGYPVSLIGWGTFYSVKCLRSLPLDKVECPVDDSARGMWLTAHGYKNYLNPFDFAAKMGPQNIEAKKNQALKWNGGDIFCLRAGHFHAKYPNFTATVPVKTYGLMTCLFLPLSFFMLLIQVVVGCCINFFYFNGTLMVLGICTGIFILLLLLLLVKLCRANLKVMILCIFGGILEGGIIYKRIWYIIVKAYIQHKWSTSAVTVKNVQRSTTLQKFKMCRNDLIVLAFALALCFILTFCVPNENLSNYVIWFNLFTFLAIPSILYILCVWLGEIPIRSGWDDSYITYPIERYDYRFGYIKNTEIWQRQHGNENEKK